MRKKRRLSLRESAMKTRIKIDSTILASLIALTGVLCIFPSLYAVNRFGDHLFALLGFSVLFFGIYLRMASRAHKKKYSQEGHGLVTTGPYHHMRNPMYLGSFLLGSGFILLVWPWWLMPLFGWLFYLRFREQIVKEEKHLKKLFGEEYESYCRRVPRIFPQLSQLTRSALQKNFPWDEIWMTKEKYGLMIWPLVGYCLKISQEKVVFGSFAMLSIAGVLLAAVVLFEAGLWLVYRRVLSR